MLSIVARRCDGTPRIDFSFWTDDHKSGMQQVLAAIAAHVQATLDGDQGYLRQPLSELNQEAAQLHKAGDPLSALGAYAKLFAKARRRGVGHADLHVCYSNRASAFLEVRIF